MGIDGHTLAHTPALDMLAQSGLRFRHAYCSNPVCGPARASLWTGLYTHHHGVVANEVPWPAGLKSIADFFRDAGYETGAIGKMHFADAHTHGFEYRLDFNDWYQYLGPKAKLYANEVGHTFPGDGHPQIRSLWRDMPDPWKDVYEPDGRQGTTHLGRASKMAEQDHFDSFVARESVEYLRRHGRSGPFFLVSSFLKPHQPFMPAARFAAMYRPEDMRMPDSWGKVDPATMPQFQVASTTHNTLTPELLDPKKAVERIAAYYGSLAQADDCLGQVLSALRDLGLEDDTIVVYTSDHGEMLGEHSLWQKFVFYESSVGVPLMMRVPGIAAAGSVCQAPVSHVSVAPTLAELCGIATPATFDGESLVRFLQKPELTNNAPVFSEYDLGTPKKKYMIRQGGWKYCHYHTDVPQMFNLKEDSSEMRNLALDPEHRERRKELYGRLCDWHAEVRQSVPSA
jgi:choline-sulfatase